MISSIFKYIFVREIIYIMKTTIDLPDDLINEAMRITGAKTKIDTIKAALTHIIKIESTKKLLKFKGKVDLRIDLDSLRKR